jgi:hypothetical protein
MNITRARSLLVASLVAVAAAPACAAPTAESSSSSTDEAFDAVSWRLIGYANAPKQLGVGRDPDGRLELFALTRDGQLLRSVQIAPNGAFGAFVDMGAHGLRMFSVLPNADGRLEVFALGGDHALYHVWQSSPGGAWNASWSALEGRALQQIDTARNQDGRLEVFALGGDGAIYHIWQSFPGANFGTWQYLGGTKIAQVSAATDADGRLEVLALGSDHIPYRIAQVQPNGGFGGWEYLGRAQSHFKSLRIGKNADGRLELFGITDAAQVAHAWQIVPNGEYSDFVDYASLPANETVADLAVTNQADGRLAVFAQGSVKLHEMDQAGVNGGWHSEWQTIDGLGVWTLSAAQQADGRVRLFAMESGSVYTLQQTRPNGGWETHYVPPTIQFSQLEAPRAVWQGTQVNVAWSLGAFTGCDARAHIRITEGAHLLKDENIGISGSVSVTAADLGHVRTSAWAWCNGAPGTTVARSQDTEVDTAYNDGPTCPGGTRPPAYTFCLSAPDQTSPPACWHQATTTVLACSEDDAKKAAQHLATNWSITSGACPSNCQ